MAQINGGSTPHLGGGSPPENKRSREKSGDVDIEARGHSCGLTTTETENREAAVNMLPNSDRTMVQSCAACNKDVTGLCYIRCEECRTSRVDPRDVDLCVDCFFRGKEVFGHKRTHAYRVMDKLQTPIYTENWTAAEELSLADHTRRLGLGAWEDIADSKLFFRRKSPAELHRRYLDTYLCQYGSVLPPHYLKRREDESMEKVPIPLTDPGSCEANLRGIKVNSREIRRRTIAELGTNPRYRYEPSWQALAKKKAAKAAAATAGAASATAATARAATAGAAAGDAGAAATAGTSTAGAAAVASNTAVVGTPGGSATAVTAVDATRDAGGRDATPAASGTANGSGVANGNCTGNGNRNANGSGNADGNGNGNCIGNANGNRSANGNGTYIRNANGNATGNSNGNAIGNAKYSPNSSCKKAASDGGGRSGGNKSGSEGSARVASGKVSGTAATKAEREAEAAAAAKASQNRKKKRKVDKVNKTKEEERAIREWVAKLPGADLSGYYPLRGDFDHEHDNAAEELLTDMEFADTDHAAEKQLKLDVIGVYNHRLDLREKRKQFVIEHNLLDVHKQQAAGGKKRPKEERDLVARLRPLARFSTAEEHEELINDLLLTKKIRARIEQLQGLRQNGVSSLAGEVELDQKKRQDMDCGRFLATSVYLEYQTRLHWGRGWGRTSGRGDGGGEHRGGNLLDLTGAPGLEYMSEAEILLCSQLHMMPSYYLTIKAAMLQECARAGFLKRKNLSGLVRLDTARLEKLYDFFSTCGWVSEC
eukprot:jgi/Undpi1/2970/HiC_scaffold_14.g06347.m1